MVWSSVKLEGTNCRFGHAAVTFSDSIIITGGMRSKTAAEKAEDEIQRKLDSKTSTISDTELSETKQFENVTCDFREIGVLTVGNKTFEI